MVLLAQLRRDAAASAALCAVALTAPLARAEDPHATLLAYDAPGECPTASDFQHSVQRRSARIHFVEAGPHERRLSISLHRDGNFTIGELSLIEENGSLRKRSVRFTTCTEAIEGLALIATVSLDPEALLAPPAPETPPAPPVKPARPPVPVPVPAATGAPPHSARVQTAIGAEASAYFNALPKAAFGGTAFLDVSSGSRGFWSPSLRSAFSHVAGLGLRAPEGTANLTLTLLTLAACPLRIAGNLVEFRPCATFSGGALHARGTDTNDAQVTTRPYLSAGGVGMLSVRLGEALDIIADASLGLSLIRDRFSFGACPGPGCEPFWRTPELYLSTGLGLRLRLP